MSFGTFSIGGEGKRAFARRRSPLDHPMEAWICPSCGSTATTPYCGRCGERRLDVREVAARGKTAIEGTRSFLGRTLASLRALLSPPGRLSRDWIRGRRVGY